MKDCDIHLDIMKYKNIKIPINPVLLLVINFFLTKVFYKMPEMCIRDSSKIIFIKPSLM